MEPSLSMPLDIGPINDDTLENVGYQNKAVKFSAFSKSKIAKTVHNDGKAKFKLGTFFYALPSNEGVLTRNYYHFQDKIAVSGEDRASGGIGSLKV
jgi:hypothetical protein